MSSESIRGGKTEPIITTIPSFPSPNAGSRKIEPFEFRASRRNNKFVDHQADLFAEERQELLRELLQTDGKVRVQDASALFGVKGDGRRHQPELNKDI